MPHETERRTTRLQRALLAVALVLLAWPVASRAEDDAPKWIESTAQRGPVEVRLRLRPAEPAIGDPLELELRVRAEAGVELLMPEFGEALGRFAIVDFAPSETIDDGGATVAVQRYTLAPVLSGEQHVPPLRVEFVDHRPGHTPAPEDEDAWELLTEALDFQVASVLRDGQPLELRPALGELPPRREAGSAWPWAGGATALALLALAGFAAFRFWSAREARLSPYAEARSALDALLYTGIPDPTQRARLDAFFVKLSGIVRLYIERRFALRSPELTTEEFLAELRRSPDLLRSHQELLADFLGTADLVKFAQLEPERAAVERCVRAAQRFLEATREADDAPHALPVDPEVDPEVDPPADPTDGPTGGPGRSAASETGRV